MSYILDALRRAESEREREGGQVPGLNAQPAPASLGDGQAARTGLPRWALGAGAGALGVAALAWWWLAPRGASAPTAAPPAPTVAQAATRAETPALQDLRALPPAGTPAAAPAATPPLLVAPPAPPTPPAPPAPAAAPAAAPTHPPAAPIAAAPPPPVAAPRPSGPIAPGSATPARQAQAARASTAGPAAASAPGAPRATPLAELPAAQRAELPPMAIGGVIYSEQASSRFIIINGSVVREGETAAPGVVLERIAPKSAILRWRDLRIEVPV